MIEACLYRNEEHGPNSVRRYRATLNDTDGWENLDPLVVFVPNGTGVSGRKGYLRIFPGSRTSVHIDGFLPIGKTGLELGVPPTTVRLGDSSITYHVIDERNILRIRR